MKYTSTAFFCLCDAQLSGILSRNRGTGICVPLPGWDDHSAMRGDQGRVVLAARIIFRVSTPLRLGTCRMLGRHNRRGRLGLAWLCADYSRAHKLGRVPPSPYLQKRATAQHAGVHCHLLWAERRKLRVTSSDVALCLRGDPRWLASGRTFLKSSGQVSAFSRQLSAFSRRPPSSTIRFLIPRLSSRLRTSVRAEGSGVPSLSRSIRCTRSIG